MRTVILLGALVGFVVRVGAQNLDDSAVEKAIKAGSDNNFRQWLAECKANAPRSEKRKHSWTRDSVHFTGAFQVTISTNVGRVAILAAESKGQQKPLRAADVPERFRREGLHVLVDPVKPGRDWGGGVEVPASIDQVVLRSKTQPNAGVKPEAFDTEDVTWDLGRVLVARARGGSWEKNLFRKSRAAAMFSLEAVRSLPTGDFDIVLITQPMEEFDTRPEVGERVCTIRVKDRLRLVP